LLLAAMMGLWVGCVLGIAAALARAPAPEGTPDYAMAFQHPLVVAGIAAGYLLMAPGLGVVIRIYLTRDIRARIAETTAIHNLAAADGVVGQGSAADALGEGFAGGLDLNLGGI